MATAPVPRRALEPRWPCQQIKPQGTSFPLWLLFQRPLSSYTVFMTTHTLTPFRDGLRTLKTDYPTLAADLGVDPSPAWLERLATSVLPAVDFDAPVLLVAICGGGSTGKSSLFNALAGEPLSEVAFRAGLTVRILLAGHPDVLSSPEVARSLLHRLPQEPVPWHNAEDATRPGPPLYAASRRVPCGLLLIDTPDFDTGEGERLINRERAEPVLRTAEVVIYLFTNTVYNNLSNTRFMAEVVGGIGGRPTILVYRITRAAPDAVVLEHCQHVARQMYGEGSGRNGWPTEVVGVYRIHESDRVARGEDSPQPLPVGDVTQEKPLPQLLADLDIASVKRHVFDADLRVIRAGAVGDLARLEHRADEADLYRQALQHLMTQHALDALKAFPASEAVALATRLFLESSPAAVRVMRQTGRVVGAPFRGIRSLVRRGAEAAGLREAKAAPPDLSSAVGKALLAAANDLRNHLMDDHLIVSVTGEDELYAETRLRERTRRPAPEIENLGAGSYNLHVPVPATVQAQADALLAQDWATTRERLRLAAEDIVGLPGDIEEELRDSVSQFRAGMGLGQRFREAFFASLSALPPLLGVTYTLLTANPVAGGGIWIQLEGLFGLNDLWALVSIPASAGLSDQDRKQLQQMIAPVFRVWLRRRAETIVDLYRDTVCQPAWDALERTPRLDDSRFEALANALTQLEPEA